MTSERFERRLADFGLASKRLRAASSLTPIAGQCCCEIVARIEDAIDESFTVFPVDITLVATLPAAGALRRAIDRDGITIYDRASTPSSLTTR